MTEDRLSELEATVEDIVTAIAASAEEIRGYEDVKRRNIERFRSQSAELSSHLPEIQVTSRLAV